MNLVIFNGSPRRKKSNSRLLIEQFLDGYKKENQEEVKIFYLAEVQKTEQHVEAFWSAETVIIILPLYTDSMPGIVKLFLEHIYLNPKKKKINMGIIIQSGFPEAHHSVYLERYFIKFMDRIQANSCGIVIKGGIEGIQIQPPMMTKKIFGAFRKLGQDFAVNNQFNNDIIEQLRKPYKLSIIRLWLFKLLSSTGITNFYWNQNLKKNQAWDQRFDQPYLNGKF